MKFLHQENEKVKIQIVTLENLSDEDREISLFYYAKIVLGVYEYDSSRYITTEIMKNEIKDNNSLDGILVILKGIILTVNTLETYMLTYTILGGNKLSFTGDRENS